MSYCSLSKAKGELECRYPHISFSLIRLSRLKPQFTTPIQSLPSVYQGLSTHYLDVICSLHITGDHCAILQGGVSTPVTPPKGPHPRAVSIPDKNVEDVLVLVEDLEGLCLRVVSQVAAGRRFRRTFAIAQLR